MQKVYNHPCPIKHKEMQAIKLIKPDIAKNNEVIMPDDTIWLNLVLSSLNSATYFVIYKLYCFFGKAFL